MNHYIREFIFSNHTLYLYFYFIGRTTYSIKVKINDIDLWDFEIIEIGYFGITKVIYKNYD